MAIDADDVQMRQSARLAIDAQGFPKGDAELVFLQSSRDIRMGFRVHIRIHAQADRRLRLHLTRHFVQSHQLAFRFDVETQNTGGQCGTHVFAGLAHA